MLKTISLKKSILDILNNKVNGKNYIVTGGAKI